MATNAAIQERIANLGGIGVAAEATFGTPVAVKQFSDAMSTSLKPDPGLFSPKQMVTVRDSQIFSLYGQQKLQGDIGGMLVPTNAIDLLVYAIGGDEGSAGTANAVNGDTGTLVSGGASTTISGSGNLAAGSSSFTVASASGWATGNYVQFGTANTPAGNVPEVRKITVSGSTFTLDTPTQFAHAQGVSGVTLLQVQAPFTHNIKEVNYLTSLTVEKNIGGYQSEQYAGMKVNKYVLKAPATNNPVDFTATMAGKSWTYLTTPTTLVPGAAGAAGVNLVTTDAPFVFGEAALTLGTTTIYEAYNLNLTIDNMVAETWTNNTAPSFVTAQGLHVSGSFDAVFGSINDATIGFLNQVMTGAATAPLKITLQHPGSGQQVNLTLSTVQFATDDIQIKPDTIVTETIAFEAYYSYNSNTLSATVLNGEWLPYLAGTNG